MVTHILCERRYCLFDDSEHKEHQNRLLINNCYQITYSLKINRQIYSAPPLPLQYQVRSSQKIHDTLSEYPKFFLFRPFLPRKLLSRQTNQRTFVFILRAAYGAHMVSARKHNDLPHHCSRNFNEKHLWMRLSKTCFSPEIMPFSCPENVPQKCKWLQCVRLVINKRRSPADVAADAATSPSRFAISQNP